MNPSAKTAATNRARNAQLNPTKRTIAPRRARRKPHTSRKCRYLHTRSIHLRILDRQLTISFNLCIIARWNVTQFHGSRLAQPDHFSRITPARKPSAHSQGTIPSSSGDRIPHSNSGRIRDAGTIPAKIPMREQSIMRILTLRPRLRRQSIAAALLCLLAFFAISAGNAASPIDRDAMLNHLNSIITWYRDSGSKIQSVGLPSDAIYQDTSQNLAQQAVRLAFQSAQAAAVLANASDQSAATATPDPSEASPSSRISRKHSSPSNPASNRTNPNWMP